MNRQFTPNIRYWGAIVLVIVLLLASCQSKPQAVDTVNESEVAAAPTAVPPTDIPPTPRPEPTPEPDMITSAEEM
ncbi:MAG: hypothetical protein P8183_24045, partial [Anaerolineae bacterium]